MASPYPTRPPLFELHWNNKNPPEEIPGDFLFRADAEALKDQRM